MITTRLPALRISRIAKYFLVAIAGCTVGLILSASAQSPPTPIQVGVNGIGPLAFDTMPNLADGWSTRSFGNNAANITDITGLDAAVQSHAWSDINTNLGSSNTLPPSRNEIFRWHSTGHYIQSRPTGNDYALLLLALRNNSGQDRNTVTVDYDLGALVSSDSTIDESPGVWGHRVFYSLTGAANTWVHIPELDTTNGTQTATIKHVSITLPSAWEVGADLYFVWADDNGPSSDTPALKEGAWTIDNLAIAFGQVFPIVIGTQPHNTTLETCRATNLSVTVASGSGPITYQWFKDNVLIPGATTATYNIPNAVASQTGNYFVRISNPHPSSPVDSTHVTLTVNQDVTPPTVLSAVALLNGTNIVVTYSEPMYTNDGFLTFADPLNGSSYHLSPRGGGTTEDAIHATVNAAHTVVTLSFASPRTPNTLYDFTIDPTVSDCSQNPLTGEANGGGQIIVPLGYEIVVFPFDGPTWKYDDTAFDYTLDWIDVNFDDSAWLSGKGLLDGKTGPVSVNRTNFNGDSYINGQIIHTVLALNHPSGPYMTDRIPIYYFRTTFTLPIGLSHIKAVDLYTFSDDYDVAYFNGSTTPVHTRAGLSVAPEFIGYSGGNSVGDASREGPFSIPVSALVDGVNHIAAKEFQQAATSSDITFAYELVVVVDAFPGSGPSLAVSRDAGTGAVSLTWPAGSGAQLYEANSVDAGAGAWSLVAGAADGSYSFTPGATGQKFYTLRN